MESSRLVGNTISDFAGRQRFQNLIDEATLAFVRIFVGEQPFNGNPMRESPFTVQKIRQQVIIRDSHGSEALTCVFVDRFAQHC